jgi:signal transduction histidine kinase
VFFDVIGREILVSLHNVSYLHQAIEIWTQADALLVQFKKAGEKYHSLLISNSRNKQQIQKIATLIHQLNIKLTALETEFSEVLGEGSRWLESLLNSLLLLFIITIEAVGITLTFLTSRSLSRGLIEISTVAKAIGEGEFDRRAHISSQDEIKLVADSINHMGWLLNNTYQELEHRVHQRTLQLKEAVRVSDNFLSIASHELKTPLTSLKLQIQLRKKLLQMENNEAFSKDKIQKMLNHDERQVNWLIQLVKYMLDINNINAGKLNLRIEQINLGDLVTTTLDQLAPILNEADCHVSLNITDSVIGYWDGFRLEQVVMNLMTNAIKYGAGHFIHVTVENYECKARLIVRDQGSGIAMKDQARIFLPFERAVSEDQVSGLGLGLYIIKGIIDAHKGSISLQSEIGKGSAFIIELKPDALLPIVKNESLEMY